MDLVIAVQVWIERDPREQKRNQRHLIAIRQPREEAVELERVVPAVQRRGLHAAEQHANAAPLRPLDSPVKRLLRVPGCPKTRCLSRAASDYSTARITVQTGAKAASAGEGIVPRRVSRPATSRPSSPAAHRADRYHIVNPNAIALELGQRSSTLRH
jgi:hypothetical protein